MLKKLILLIIGIVVLALLYLYGLPYLGKKALQSGERYYYSKQYERAISKLKLAERWGKDKFRPKILTGFSYNLSGKYDLGEVKFREALAIDSRNDEASRGLFDSLFKLKRYEEAEKVAKQRLKYSPRKEDVYEELARIYSVQEKLKEAKEYAVKAVYLNDVKKNPVRYRVETRLLLASIMGGLGDNTEAIDVLLDAQNLAPDIPLVSKFLAQAYEKIGDKEKALENWQKVASLDDYTLEFRQSVEQKVIQLKAELEK